MVESISIALAAVTMIFHYYLMNSKLEKLESELKGLQYDLTATRAELFVLKTKS